MRTRRETVVQPSRTVLKLMVLVLLASLGSCTCTLASWEENGTAVSAAEGNQCYPQPASDGAGGAIVAWSDYVTGSCYDIFAQRVNADGTTPLFFLCASALVANGCVTLSWQTAMEVPQSSFSIQRAEELEGDFTELDLPIAETAQCSFSCTDYSVAPGKTYWYRIVLGSPFGREVYGPVDVSVSKVPTAYALHPVFPNPFNPFCTVRYDVPVAGRVSLRVLDVSGRIMRVLAGPVRQSEVR
ncbi:MAG: hypothetical protein AMJ46_01760 [Latescibacteria bacterium DG_63]|nr:MAG: hypothetical protein AMJ46_01760 [Latescibacteria bacterium DG_63]